jgi:hypothetical protein
MIGTAQKPLEEMVEALKGCRKVGVVSAAAPGGGRRPTLCIWLAIKV